MIKIPFETGSNQKMYDRLEVKMEKKKHGCCIGCFELNDCLESRSLMSVILIRKFHSRASGTTSGISNRSAMIIINSSCMVIKSMFIRNIRQGEKFFTRRRMECSPGHRDYAGRRASSQ